MGSEVCMWELWLEAVRVQGCKTKVALLAFRLRAAIPTAARLQTQHATN